MPQRAGTINLASSRVEDYMYVFFTVCVALCVLCVVVLCGTWVCMWYVMYYTHVVTLNTAHSYEDFELLSSI
jgi:hypothetical protein